MIILLFFVTIFFNDVSFTYAKTADDYTHEAAYNEVRKNYTQAISDCTKAIKLSPKDYFAYHLRGIVYTRKGNLTQAVSDFSKAIEINPKFYDSYVGRADAYYQGHDFLHAISDCTKAIEVSPPLSLQKEGAYSMRGQIYYMHGDYSKAILDFTKEIEFASYGAWCYFDRSLAYEAHHDYDLAINDLTRTIESNALFVSYNNNASIGYLQPNPADFQNTINYYSKAIKLNLKNAKAYYGRGLIYAFMNEYSQAITDLSKAIELNPKYGEAYYARGIAYYYDYSNQSKKAKADMQSAKKLGIVPDPDFIKILNSAN